MGKIINSDGSVDDIPFMQENLIGSDGIYPTRTRFDIVAERNATIQNVVVDLWNGPTAQCPFPASAIAMQLVSSSASDSSSGVGCRLVHIHYLDANYDEQNVAIALNGVTPVTIPAITIMRVNGMHADAVGSNGYPAGNISLQSVGGATTYAMMDAGDNRARHPLFTVPRDKTMHILAWNPSSGSSAGTHFVDMEIEATAHSGVFVPNVFIPQTGYSCQNSGASIQLPIPLRLPETTDIRITATSDAVNANATANVTAIGYLETNN
jgi:hypothetical protein